MGPARSFIESMDAQKKVSEEAKEAVGMAIKMMETRFRSFELQLDTHLGKAEKLPAHYLITAKKKIFADISSHNTKISSQINSIVEGFSKGMTKGITNIISSCLDTIMGSFSAGYNEAQEYFAVINRFGGIFRIDMLVIQQKLVSQGISKGINDITGTYLLVTSVKKESIKDENVFRVIIERQFPDSSFKQKNLLLKFIMGSKENQLTPDEETLMDGIKDVKKEVNQKKYGQQGDQPKIKQQEKQRGQKLQ